jgi:hypothetical protein
MLASWFHLRGSLHLPITRRFLAWPRTNSVLFNDISQITSMDEADQAKRKC